MLGKFITLLLCASAFANPLQSRQLQTIQTSITSISRSLTDLDTAVRSISANDVNSARNVLSKAQVVSQTMTQATRQITASQPLSLTEALQLQTSAQTLTTTAQTTINDLLSKKAVIDQLGAGNVVLQQLQQQKTAAAGLGQAVVSKVPQQGQSIAQQNIGQVTTLLDNGIRAFSTMGNGRNGTSPITGGGANRGGASGTVPVATPVATPGRGTGSGAVPSLLPTTSPLPGTGTGTVGNGAAISIPAGSFINEFGGVPGEMPQSNAGRPGPVGGAVRARMVKVLQ